MQDPHAETPGPGDYTTLDLHRCLTRVSNIRSTTGIRREITRFSPPRPAGGRGGRGGRRGGGRGGGRDGTAREGRTSSRRAIRTAAAAVPATTLQLDHLRVHLARRTARAPQQPERRRRLMRCEMLQTPSPTQKPLQLLPPTRILLHLVRH
jgi:hypothetical protein